MTAELPRHASAERSPEGLGALGESVEPGTGGSFATAPAGTQVARPGQGLDRRGLIRGALGAGVLVYAAPRIAAAQGGGEVSPNACEDTGTCPNPAIVPTANVMNDLDATQIGAGNSGLTSESGSERVITGCVYLVGTKWRIRVQSAEGTIHWGVKTPAEGGYMEPVLPPDAGANIDCANAQAAIDDMSDYETSQASGPDWHLQAASEAHEMVHVMQFTQRLQDAATWAAIETAIEAHELGDCTTMTRAQAEAAMLTYLDTQEAAWWAAREPLATCCPEAPAYEAGQDVLDPAIAAVDSWKNTNCPP